LLLFQVVLSCQTGFTFLLDEKSKQKNQVKIKLYCFSKERLSPIDAILTCPQKGYSQGFVSLLSACRVAAWSLQLAACDLPG
jgi:hypothetical protein